MKRTTVGPGNNTGLHFRAMGPRGGTWTRTVVCQRYVLRSPELIISTCSSIYRVTPLGIPWPLQIFLVSSSQCLFSFIGEIYLISQMPSGVFCLHQNLSRTITALSHGRCIFLNGPVSGVEREGSVLSFFSAKYGVLNLHQE